MPETLGFLQEVDRTDLDSKVIRAKDIRLVSAKGISRQFGLFDTLCLRVGIEKGEYMVDIVIPGNTALLLGKYYASENQARAHYTECLEQLEQGYQIRRTDDNNIELIPPG